MRQNNRKFHTVSCDETYIILHYRLDGKYHLCSCLQGVEIIGNYSHTFSKVFVKATLELDMHISREKLREMRDKIFTLKSLFLKKYFL